MDYFFRRLETSQTCGGFFMKYLALVLVFATPAVLAGTINMACPPGDTVVVHTVTNNGDFNGDGKVNLSDYSIFRANYGQSSDPDYPVNPDYPANMTDLNGDGTTDTTDYALFKMLMANQH
jgi:hypothetical protein